MKGIVLVVIGLLVNILNIPVSIGVTYPKYEKTSELGKTFQKYVIDNMVGADLKIDILSNVVGYALIIIGLIILVKSYKKFILPLIFSILALMLYVMIPLLPYSHNGKSLCFSALTLTFFLCVVNIIMQWFIVKILSKRITIMQVEQKIKAMKIGFIVAAVCQFVTFLTRFLGIDYLTVFYSIVEIASTIWFCIMIIQANHYILDKKLNL